MLVFITGGSGSGKSAYAENLVCRLSTEEKRYYLATMEAFGEEGRKRVEKHRKAREGKNFITIEQKRDLPEAVKKITKEAEPKESVCLLECMSNLVANEMFQGEQPFSEKIVTEKILKDVEEFSTNLKHLVIVSNNVFEDGILYDEVTAGYNRALGQINQELTRRADVAVEVVVGIPVVWKGKEVEEIYEDDKKCT